MRFTLPSQGLVAAERGAIEFRAGGTQAATFQATQGATIVFSGNAVIQNFNAGTSFIGEGLVRFIDGLDARLARDVTLFASNIEIGDGAGALGGADLSGRGTLSIGSLFKWTGGDISAEATILVGSSTQAEISGAAVKTLDGAFLVNRGALTWTAGDIVVRNDSQLQNFGTFNVQTAASIRAGAAQNPGTFINVDTGRFVKAADRAATTIQIAFENRGLVDRISLAPSQVRSAGMGADLQLRGSCRAILGAWTNPTVPVARLCNAASPHSKRSSRA